MVTKEVKYIKLTGHLKLRQSGRREILSHGAADMVMVVADTYAHKVKDQATRGEADSKAVKYLAKHLFVISPLCSFKCFLKLSTQEDDR